MRIFVTGFDGYVGSQVVSALRSRGARLSALVRSADQAALAEERGLDPVRASLEDTMALGRAVRGADGVGHFAASENPAFLPTSRAAVSAMLEAMRPGGSLVMQGGTMVFGEQGRDEPARPLAYAAPPPLAGRAKLDREILDWSAKDRRTFVVYGAFVHGGVGAMIPGTLARAAAKVGYSAYPLAGDAVWSAVHVEDWAELMALVLGSGEPGGQPVVAAAQDITIADAASLIGAVMDPHLPARSVTLDEARVLWPTFADGLTMHQRYDGIPARERFGWAPRREAFKGA